MKLGVQKEYPLIPAGVHRLKLASYETVEFDDQYGKSESGKVQRVKWRFVSKETDDDGTPYDFVVYTNLDYGFDKASLTHLIDNLIPGMTKEAFGDYDCDDLLGCVFEASIKHTTNEKGAKKATYIYMKPASKAKPLPSESPAEKPTPETKAAQKQDDPFEDD